jgi:hypothetical protein
LWESDLNQLRQFIPANAISPCLRQYMSFQILDFMLLLLPQIQPNYIPVTPKVLVLVYIVTNFFAYAHANFIALFFLFLLAKSQEANQRQNLVPPRTLLRVNS